MRRLLLALALVAGTATAAPAPAPTPAPIDSVYLGAAEPAYHVDSVFLAGQPAQEDFAVALKKSRIRTIINLRPAREIDFDERAVAIENGFAYEHVPVAGADDLTDATFDRVRKLLAGKKPILLHCASGNRVGAVWLPWRVLDGKLDLDAALAEARKIGLESPDLEKRALAYIEARRAEQPPAAAAPTPAEK